MTQPTPDREVKTLLSYLNAQREHALGILEGLDEAALRRPPCRRAGPAWA